MPRCRTLGALPPCHLVLMERCLGVGKLHRAQSVQRWARGWTIGILGFDSRRGLGIFLFTTASRTALGPSQPPIQWVSGTVSLGINRQEHEADHSPPSNAEVKEWVELYLQSPSMPSWLGAQLKSTGISLPLPFTFYYTVDRRCLDP
jgi:hypothetical protein